MPSDIAEVSRLKKQADADARRAAEAEGAYKEVMRRLEVEYGVKTIEDAEKKLKSLENDVKKAEGVFNKALESFHRDYDVSIHNDLSA